MATLGFSLLAQSGSASGADPINTASLNPTGNRLYVAVLGQYGGTPATVTGLSGWGLTWTQIEQVTSNTTRLTVHVASSATDPSSGGVVSWNMSGAGMNGYGYIVFEVSGVDIATANGVVQSDIGTGVYSATATLAAFGSSSNATLGVSFANESTAATTADTTPGSGFTQRHELLWGTSNRKCVCVFSRDDADTTVDASAGTAIDDFVIVGVELKAPGQYLDLTSATSTNAAQALSITHVHYRTITPATSSNAAQAIALRGRILHASEIDAAQELRYLSILKDLTPATSTNSAQELTRLDAYAVAVLSDGPVGYWRMDTADDSLQPDISGNGNDWALDTDTTPDYPILQEPSLLTDGNYSIGFGPGSANLIAVVDAAASGYSGLSSTSDTLSYVFWYDLTGCTDASEVSLWNGVAGSQHVSLQAGYLSGVFYAQARIFNTADANWKQAYDSGSTPAKGMLALTYDGTTLRFYQNGAVGDVTDATASGTMETASNDLQLRLVGRTSEAFVDEIAIFSGVLTTEQIANYWTLGTTHQRMVFPPTSTNVAQALDYGIPVQDVDIVPATSSNAAQTLSVTKTIYKSLTASTSTDAAQALSITKTIYKSLTTATSTNVAQALSVTKTKYLTLASATSSNVAQALGVTKPIHKSLVAATSADAAQTFSITHVHYRTVVPATETDAAQARTFTHVHYRTVVPATETDAAQARTFTQIHYRTITPTVEADAAQIVHYTNYELLNPAYSTNAAQALSITKTKYLTLTAALETDVAQAVHFLNIELIVPATSTNAAQALDKDKHAALVPASSLNSAQVFDVEKEIEKSLTPVTSANAAQVLDKDKQRALIAATSTNAAQTLSVTHIHAKTLVPAISTNVSQALSITKVIYKTLVPATSTNVAQTLSYPNFVDIDPATETDLSVALRWLNYESLNFGAETDAAQTLDKDKHAALTAASSPNTAVALAYTKTILESLTPATSTDAAQGLDRDKHVTLAPASSSNAAVALIYPNFETLTAATEADQAQSLSYLNFEQTTPALETDSAQVLSITKTIFKILGVAAETGSAQALIVTKPLLMSLVAAAATDSAQAISTTKTIYKLITPPSGVNTAIDLTYFIQGFDPLNLQVVITSSTAHLTWTASETPGVADYSVFRRTPQTGLRFDPLVDMPVAEGVTLTEYDDADLPVGDYDWQVFGRVVT